MAKTDNLGDFLTDIADAIREKTGKSDQIDAQNFSEEIRNISGGSGSSSFIGKYTLPILQNDSSAMYHGEGDGFYLTSESYDPLNSADYPRADFLLTDENTMLPYNNISSFEYGITFKIKDMSKIVPNIRYYLFGKSQSDTGLNASSPTVYFVMNRFKTVTFYINFTGARGDSNDKILFKVLEATTSDKSLEEYYHTIILYFDKQAPQHTDDWFEYDNGAFVFREDTESPIITREPYDGRFPNPYEQSTVKAAIGSYGQENSSYGYGILFDLKNTYIRYDGEIVWGCLSKQFETGIHYN